MVTLAGKRVNNLLGVTTPYRDKSGMSQMATTGSITAGSADLTVDDVMDLRVGDWVIIELGGEAGAGAWGTVGVGGSWPTQSYADEAAILADTSQPLGMHVYAEDTRICYRWNRAGNNQWEQITAAQYYWRKVAPKALWAEILSIAGNVLTLSKTATLSSTNANVYFDNWGIVRAMVQSPARTITLPAGTYYMSDVIGINNRPNTVVQGAGMEETILKSPLGCSHGGITFSVSDNCEAKDFTLDLNWLNNGYGYRYTNGRSYLAGDTPALAETAAPGGSNVGNGLYFQDSDNCVARRVKSINSSQDGVSCNACLNFEAYDCYAVTTDPAPRYIQWQFNHSVSTGKLVRCHAINAYYNPSFEVFGSGGGVEWIDCVGVNALVSLNSCQNVTVRNMHLTMEQDKLVGAGGVEAVALSNPVFSNNVNTGGGGLIPNKVYNLTIINNRAKPTGQRLACIGSDATATPLELYGTYDSDFVTPKGLIQQNDPPVFGTFDGLGFNCNTPDGVIVQGMRFRGTGPEDPARRMIFAYGSGTITITNCVLDDGVNGGGVTYAETDTLTNAEFDALHPGLP
jgi:hypothetical protein